MTEHGIQKHAKMWVRDAIAIPHQFLAFDRGKASGQWTHMRQKARGAVKGTPDSLLVADGKHVWCEFKAPGKKPDEAQNAVGAFLMSLGDHWFWTDSVIGYAMALEVIGIPMRRGWSLMAENHQARAQGEIERAQLKAGKVPARLKVSSGRVTAATRRFEKVRHGL